MAVVNRKQGDEFGKISARFKDLVINWRSGGYIEYAVLSFGGFLGLGDKYFAVRVEGFSDEQRQGAFHPECERRATEKCAGGSTKTSGPTCRVPRERGWSISSTIWLRIARRPQRIPPKYPRR
jgi:hypothetical protein